MYVLQYCHCCDTSHICAKGLIQVTATFFILVFTCCGPLNSKVDAGN